MGMGIPVVRYYDMGKRRLFVIRVLVMSSCIRNWGLAGTPVPEENSEKGQKLGSCAYPD